MKELSGRVAVVTGAASGIGFALCGRFAAEGMRIAMADLPGSPLEEVAQRLRASGAEVLPVAADVSDWPSMQNFSRQVQANFGGAHVLCNNAGVRSMGPAWETTLEDWHWVMNVNFMGVLHGIKAFVPQMIERKEPGHIVNTASVAGLLAFKHTAPYCASKAAVVSLSEVLAQELCDAGAPIGVSVLCPGSVPTHFRENSNRLRPSGEKVELRKTESPGARSADAVAECVVDSIRNDRFWILSHPGYETLLERRLNGMVNTNEVVPGQAL